MKKKYSYLVILILFIIAILITIFFYGTSDYKYYNDGLLYINEIMPSNKYTLLDNYDNNSDYIELYNGYDYDINLEGYQLSDKDSNNDIWEFPNIVIPSKSYLLVYASGLNKCDENICHTNFKLSSSGETVTLSNPSNKILSKIKYEKVDSDISYGYNGNKYVYYYVGTPGIENYGEYSDTSILRSLSDTKLSITEYTNNNSSILGVNNKYYSLIELYNDEDYDINLDGYHLTDNSSNPNKATFTNLIIPSKSYMTIYLTNEEIDKPKIDINLDTTDKELLLINNKNEIVDQIRIEALPTNMVASLYNNTWLYSYINTFNNPNKNIGSTDILSEVINDKKIIITEVSNNAVELKNITNSDINLINYSLSGNSSGNKKITTNTIIKANSYLVLYENNLGFKISSTNETISLYDTENRLLDRFVSGKLTDNTSYGLNNNNERVIYSVKTLGYDNNTKYYKGYSSKVNFSIQGGYIESGTKVSLSTNDNSEIYYTLDGSFPNKNSNKYTDPITIDKTSVLKAISIKEDYLDSDVTSRTYIVGRKHDMAVVSISSDYNNLYSSNSGILNESNYRRDWERKVSFEFYENDGTFGVMFNAGARLTGADSREFPQKSISIMLRNNYGIDEVNYPFFTDHDVTTFSSFTLRNSGEDVTFLKFKDAFLTEVLKGQMDLDFQYYRPVVVYINGEYYGVYNIREKINESYLANNHGVDKDNVTLIKGSKEVQAGNMDDYNSLINYVTTHDMSIQSNYEYIKTKIDIQELINYWVVQTYYHNTDTGNIRYWKENTEDGKWRWVLYDQDWALWPSTHYNPALFYPFEPYGHGVHRYFSTMLTYRLYKNSEFKDLYLKTFAYHLKNTFNPERMLTIFDEVKALYENELPYHFNRWYNDFKNHGKQALTVDIWNSNIEKEKYVIRNRYEIVKRNLKSEFKLSDSEYNYYFGDL